VISSVCEIPGCEGPLQETEHRGKDPSCEREETDGYTATPGTFLADLTAGEREGQSLAASVTSLDPVQALVMPPAVVHR
jgi:hypothetical protein